MIAVKLLFLICVIFGFCYCGLTRGDVGIIGGHEVTIDMVPFMVSFRLNATYHWCGGSIVHERFVLTAAHCIVPNRLFKIKAGTDHVDRGGILYDIEKIIPHEKYSNKTFVYDVCLIKLTEAIKFGRNVAAIKLADHTMKLGKGSLVNITGWGSTGVDSYSTHLMQVSIPTITRRECQMYYFGLKITPQMVCAGKLGMDSCQVQQDATRIICARNAETCRWNVSCACNFTGNRTFQTGTQLNTAWRQKWAWWQYYPDELGGDSGGPLTKGDVQVGVTSFGLGCGEVPGVYVRVSTVRTWVLDTISRNL